MANSITCCGGEKLKAEKTLLQLSRQSQAMMNTNFSLNPKIEFFLIEYSKNQLEEGSVLY